MDGERLLISGTANGIEYGVMVAYAEGMDILSHANVGKSKQAADAEASSNGLLAGSK